MQRFKRLLIHSMQNHYLAPDKLLPDLLFLRGGETNGVYQLVVRKLTDWGIKFDNSIIQNSKPRRSGGRPKKKQ